MSVQDLQLRMVLLFCIGWTHRRPTWTDLETLSGPRHCWAKKCSGRVIPSPLPHIFTLPELTV